MTTDPGESDSLPSFKKQKRQEDEDRISGLPECLLLFILSFLPTEDAVRTSTLSKRWKYLWTSLCSIKLDDSPLDWSPKYDCCPIQKLHFLNFADNLLFHHDASNIENFHLSLHLPGEQSRVNAWISVAISHRVRELVLSLSDFSSYIFPSSLFNFETLSVLKLSYCSLHIPIASRFRNLTTCHFSYVTFVNDRTTPCLIPNSPVLCDLLLENCRWKKSTTFIICIPSLKRFKMRSDDLRQSMQIYAPKLETLKLCGCFFFANFLLHDRSSLAKASLDFSIRGSSSEREAERIVKVFISIQLVESLKIDDSVLRAFNMVQDLPVVDQLRMPNLTHLKVLNDYCFLDGTSIIGALLRSPKVESLYIDACRGDYNDSYFWVWKEWMQYSPPSSFKPPLKRVTIDGFRGNVAEMHLLEILLKHSGSLESIHLNCLTPMSKELEKLQEIYNMLLMLPRASPSCVIKLC